jgi:hypothetical protein
MFRTLVLLGGALCTTSVSGREPAPIISVETSLLCKMMPDFKTLEAVANTGEPTSMLYFSDALWRVGRIEESTRLRQLVVDLEYGHALYKEGARRIEHAHTSEAKREALRFLYRAALAGEFYGNLALASEALKANDASILKQAAIALAAEIALAQRGDGIRSSVIELREELLARIPENERAATLRYAAEMVDSIGMRSARLSSPNLRAAIREANEPARTACAFGDADVPMCKKAVVANSENRTILSNCKGISSSAGSLASCGFDCLGQLDTTDVHFYYGSCGATTPNVLHLVSDSSELTDEAKDPALSIVGDQPKRISFENQRLKIETLYSRIICRRFPWDEITQIKIGNDAIGWRSIDKENCGKV